MTNAATISKKTAVRRRDDKGFRKNKYMYMMLLPAVLLVLFIQYAPYFGLLIAFKDYDVLKGFAGSPWVGIENFRTIFSMPNILNSIKNTLVYSSVLLFGTFPFPIMLALMFNEVQNKYFKKVTQTITYLPHFLSWISVVGFFYSMFSNEGSFNFFMMKIFGEGYQAPNILYDSKYFLGILFASNLWKSIGWSSIIYLASITGIDQGLYEAAEIDGCNRLQQIWHITLPGLRTVATLMLILNIGNLVTTSFDQVYGFQNIYTQDATDTIGTLLYRQGIQGGKYSLATALGMAQGIVSLILVMASNFISKKISNVGLW